MRTPLMTSEERGGLGRVCGGQGVRDARLAGKLIDILHRSAKARTLRLCKGSRIGEHSTALYDGHIAGHLLLRCSRLAPPQTHEAIFHPGGSTDTR